jgi:4-amino-4-deoxy-L-arabinose transferase-like glycosyltransferase
MARTFARPADLSGLDILLVFVIAVVMAGILFQTIFMPLYEWAARTVFDFTAKILYHEKTIYTAALTQTDHVHEHPEYPMLAPLLSDWFFTVLGRYDDRLGKIWSFMISSALILSLYSLVRKFASRRFALISTLFFCSIETFMKRSTIGEADIPLSFFYFVSGGYLFVWMKDRIRAHLVISALFAAFAIFTKTEGTAFFAILWGCLSVYIVSDNKTGTSGKIRAVLFFGVLALLPVLPWLIFKSRLPTSQVLLTAAEFNPLNVAVKFWQNQGRSKEILGYFIDQILIKREWHVFWLMFLTLQVICIPVMFRRPLVFLAMNVWLTLLTYYTMFMIIWLIPGHMLVGMGRFMLQVAPLTTLLMALEIRESGIF